MFGISMDKEDHRRTVTSAFDDRMKAVLTRNGLTLYKRSDSSMMSENSIPLQPDHSPEDAA